MPITNSLQNGDLSDTMILNDDARIVVDLAGNIETGNKVIEELEERHGDKKYLLNIMFAKWIISRNDTIYFR